MNSLHEFVRQPDPVQMCADVEQVPAAPRWVTAALAGLYIAILIGACALALGWHTDAVQGLLSVLRGQA